MALTLPHIGPTLQTLPLEDLEGLPRLQMELGTLAVAAHSMRQLMANLTEVARAHMVAVLPVGLVTVNGETVNTSQVQQTNVSSVIFLVYPMIHLNFRRA